MSNIIQKKSDLNSDRLSEQGFTLLELMIAMVLFLVVTGSIYGLLRVGRTDANRASQRSDLMKNGRLALHLIGRDVLNAGLGYNRSGALVPDDFITTKLGLTPDDDTDRNTLTGITGGDNVFPNILADSLNDKTDVIAFAYRDLEFNPDPDPDIKSRYLIGIVNATNGGGATNARAITQTATADSPGADAKNAKKFDLYLLESGTSQLAVMATDTDNKGYIDFANADPLGINQPFNITGEGGSLLKSCTATITEDCTTYSADKKTTIYSLKRFFWVSYKVKSDGTLVRIVYGNNRDGLATEQIQETPLATNIKDLQFRYVMSDGSVTDNPAAWGDTPKAVNFNLVRQVLVTIKIQSDEVDEQTRKPLTLTLTGAFSTRNIEYDAG